MKIRQGFVSNSSSSSFVVAFPHKPTNVADVQTMMFGTQNVHYTGETYRRCSSNDSNEVPVSEIAQHVFNKIEQQATFEEICESIRNGWFDFYLIEDLFPGHYDDWNDPERISLDERARKDSSFRESNEYYEAIRKIYERTDKINNERAKKIAESFCESNKDKFIAVMSFSDNDGSFNAMLEHSGIFYRLDHIRTSYH